MDKYILCGQLVGLHTVVKISKHNCMLTTNVKWILLATKRYTWIEAECDFIYMKFKKDKTTPRVKIMIMVIFWLKGKVI